MDEYEYAKLIGASCPLPDKPAPESVIASVSVDTTPGEYIPVWSALPPRLLGPDGEGQREINVLVSLMLGKFADAGIEGVSITGTLETTGLIRLNLSGAYALCLRNSLSESKHKLGSIGGYAWSTNGRNEMPILSVGAAYQPMPSPVACIQALGAWSIRRRSLHGDDQPIAAPTLAARRLRYQPKPVAHGQPAAV